MTAIRETAEKLWRGELTTREQHPFTATGELEEIAPKVAFCRWLANFAVCKTDEGLVLIDCGSYLNQEETLAKVRSYSSARVHTVIYTHGHLDHAGGMGPVAAEAGRNRVARPRVVGHRAIAERFDRYKRAPQYHWRVDALVFGAEAAFPTDFVYPDTNFDHQLNVVAGAEKFQCHHARGETEDHCWVYIPSAKVLCTGDFFIWAAPAAGHPLKTQRYARDWAEALRAMAKTGAEILLPGHGSPIFGAIRVRQALNDTAEYLSKIHDQALELINQGAALDEVLHSVKPRAGRRHRAVDRRQQAALALPGERRHEFEIAPRRGVDLHDRTRHDAARRLEIGRRILLGQGEIVDQRPGGGQFGAPEGPEAVEGADLIEAFEAAAPGLAVKAGVGQRRQRPLPLAPQLAQGRPRQQALGQQDLARPQAGKLAGQRRLGGRGEGEGAGRKIKPGQAQFAPRLGKAGEVIVPVRFEDPVLGHGAGGDDAHDRALERAFAAAPPGFRGILDLLADRDLETGANQPGEIDLGGMHRNPAHRDIGALVPAAPGQRDIERLRRGDRIVKEQLEEVPHAEKQQAARMGALDLVILRHHRREGRGRAVGRGARLSGHRTRRRDRRRGWRCDANMGAKRRRKRGSTWRRRRDPSRAFARRSPPSPTARISAARSRRCSPPASRRARCRCSPPTKRWTRSRRRAGPRPGWCRPASAKS